MDHLLLGTTDGIWRLRRDGRDASRLTPARLAVTYLVADGRGNQYATDGRQVWRSEDGWRNATGSSFPAGLHVTALAASPHAPYPLFAGTIPAALYRSDDSGATWREVVGFARCPGYDAWTFPGPSPLPRVNALGFDAVEAELLYATVEVGGIVRSRDGGATWENCSLEVNRDAHFLAAHPARARLVYASAGFGSRQPGGIYRSADGGESWEYRFAGLTPAYTRPLLVDERADDLVYVAATPQQPPYWALPEGPQAVLWRGRGGGEEWDIVFPGAANIVAASETTHLISALARDPDAAGAVFLARSEVPAVLHAQGALGRPPGGPFPPPAPAAPTQGDAGVTEIAQARRLLQHQLSALTLASRRGRGELWRLDPAGAALCLCTDLPAVLAILAA